MHHVLMKEGNYTPLLTAIPTCDFQSKFCQISSYFAYLFYIMNKCQKLKVVLDEVFIDEFSNFDPDIADSLSNSIKRVSKTSRQDSVKISDSFHTHFDASNSQPSNLIE